MVTATREVADDPTTRAVARFRLRARRRALWLKALWAGERDGRNDAPDAERAFVATDEVALELTASLAGVEAMPRSPRLDRLAHVFGLDDRELDYLEACLAVDVDPSLGALLGFLADHPTRSYPTESSIARLYDHGLARVLVPESPVARWRLVESEPVGPGEPAALALDPLVRDWLVGQRRLDGALVGLATIVAPHPPLHGWPVHETAAWMSAAVRGEHGIAHVRVLGAAGSGRRTFAACVAAELGVPLLAVADGGDPNVVLAAHRQAFLDGCALAWIGDPTRARVASELPLQFTITEAATAAFDGRTIELPALEIGEREALWRARLPDASPEGLTSLARAHRSTPGEIAAIAERGARSVDEASTLAREGSRHRLGELARWMECPFQWDDLIVPRALRDALEDLVFEAQHRGVVWEQPGARRLFPQGRGLFAMFTGSPGTGKTMAAQVIAATLGLDLFRISLASVVSKYVGETSRNLQAVLARAEAMDAVLLFDEADALFGKRTEIKDAHDRFANTDTDHLLQAIEAYRGIVMLTTNKKANIDAAFTRRLRWILDFPRPDAAHRLQLWTRLVDELASEPRAKVLAPQLETIAATFDVTGAQIKYAVLTAVYAAAREPAALESRHLVRGLDRELAKEGRALSERDKERIADA